MFDFNVRPIAQKWFSAATPVNYISGLTTTIGSGDNGTITIVDNTAESLSVEVVVAGTANASLSAAFANSTITVTLGTDAESAAKAPKTGDAQQLTTWLVLAAAGSVAAAAAARKRRITKGEN